ncbi:unnamed protein product, partial [Amoebophrya sp. A120]
PLPLLAEPWTRQAQYRKWGETGPRPMPQEQEFNGPGDMVPVVGTSRGRDEYYREENRSARERKESNAHDLAQKAQEVGKKKLAEFRTAGKS